MCTPALRFSSFKCKLPEATLIPEQNQLAPVSVRGHASPFMDNVHCHFHPTKSKGIGKIQSTTIQSFEPTVQKPAALLPKTTTTSSNQMYFASSPQKPFTCPSTREKKIRNRLDLIKNSRATKLARVIEQSTPTGAGRRIQSSFVELLQLGLELLHLQAHGPLQRPLLGLREPPQQPFEPVDGLLHRRPGALGLLVEVHRLLRLHRHLDLLPRLRELQVYRVHLRVVLRRRAGARLGAELPPPLSEVGTGRAPERTKVAGIEWIQGWRERNEGR